MVDKKRQRREGRERKRVQYTSLFLLRIRRERPTTRNLLIANDGPVVVANCESGTIRLKLREWLSYDITWAGCRLPGAIAAATRSYRRA